jgi:hypothetical protein
MDVVLSLVAAASAGIVVRVLLFHGLGLKGVDRPPRRSVIAELLAIAAGATTAVVLFSGEFGEPSTGLMVAMTLAGVLALVGHRRLDGDEG